MLSESISGHHLLVLSLLFLIFHFSSQSDHLQHLLKFKPALSNPTSQVFKTWNKQTSICNFTEIVCGSDHSVKEINLSQQLMGNLSFDSICSLQSLEKISLGSNLLYGTISNDLSSAHTCSILIWGRISSPTKSRIYLR